jgi:thioredoxin reductase (NADPH)
VHHGVFSAGGSIELVGISTGGETVLSHVHILVRGVGLAETMSRHLISRIEASREITLRTLTEIEALEGDGHLERIRWRDTTTGTSDIHDIRHLFVMTGAEPNTAWLRGCLELDAKRFIRTGADLGPGWPLRRAPHVLETSLPGIFAVGIYAREA